MTYQLVSNQILDIAEVKTKVAEIKKKMDELYDRPFIPTPVIVEVNLEI